MKIEFKVPFTQLQVRIDGADWKLINLATVQPINSTYFEYKKPEWQVQIDKEYIERMERQRPSTDFTPIPIIRPFIVPENYRVSSTLTNYIPRVIEMGEREERK